MRTPQDSVSYRMKSAELQSFTPAVKRNRGPALTNKRGNFQWPGIASVDQVMAEERSGAFAKRSIKTSAKLAGLKMAVAMMDLTTLEGKDTAGKVAYLCRK